MSRVTRKDWSYSWMVIRGRMLGAVRVLLGKSASIPKGLHNTRTALGEVRVTDYYGGCTISLPEADLYWFAHKFDGSGAGPGQALFNRTHPEHGS